MNILLKINDDNTTNARFEYTATSVTEKGNDLVDNLDEVIVKNASGLGMMINYYLQNGTKLEINK